MHINKCIKLKPLYLYLWVVTLILLVESNISENHVASIFRSKLAG